MRWPWQRRRTTTVDQLDAARRERDDARRKGREREPLIRRAEQHLREDTFGERWRSALGGNGQ